MRHRIINTFTGPFALIEHDGELSTTWINRQTRSLLAASREDARLQPDLVKRLVRFFMGEDVDFSDVATPAGSDFFARCWEACRRIPRGETRSYAGLAKMARSGPGAARAAGQAMRRNPMPVIVPCHRVIGSTGTLHGFGGTCDARSDELQIKTKLLRMEGALEQLDSRPRRMAVAT